MKTMTMAAALAALALAGPPAFAVEEHHPEQQAKPEAAKPAPTQPAAREADQAAQRLKDNLKKMEGQVEKIRKTKDPNERDRLLREHMQSMRENMMMAQSMMEGPGMGMMGGAMMNECMKMMGGGMMGGSAPEAMMGRMQQMEKRMDMMQMMMEQMLKQQNQPMPAK